MATIIDVARMAGVSQGTASNVLNGKGNVSSEKIKAVEEAAKKLGYTINERAKMLRKGSGNIICVIVPSMERRHYRDFYYCLKSYAEKRGYTAELLITNDNRQTEYSMIQWAKSVMAMGVASITCLGERKSKRHMQDLKSCALWSGKRPMIWTILDLIMNQREGRLQKLSYQPDIIMFLW